MHDAPPKPKRKIAEKGKSDMTKNWHKYQTMMVNADQAIDHFHALLIAKRYSDAAWYLDSIRDIVTIYYGSATFEELQGELNAN